MKLILYSAPLFTFSCAIIVGLFLPEASALLNVTPPPDMTSPLFNLLTHMIAALLVGYGLGYTWLALNPYRNIAILKLGIWVKLILVLVVLGDVISGSVSWQIMVPVSGDIIYALLFAYVLLNLPETGRG